MPNKTNSRKSYGENFKRAALQFMDKTGGSVESTAAELGVPAQELETWSRDVSLPPRPPGNQSSIARLKAENEALRHEVLHLQMQWDILKTTLSVLSAGMDHSTAA
jgi:transposase-like protein